MPLLLLFSVGLLLSFSNSLPGLINLSENRVTCVRPSASSCCPGDVPPALSSRVPLPQWLLGFPVSPPVSELLNLVYPYTLCCRLPHNHRRQLETAHSSQVCGSVVRVRSAGPCLRLSGLNQGAAGARSSLEALGKGLLRVRSGGCRFLPLTGRGPVFLLGQSGPPHSLPHGPLHLQSQWQNFSRDDSPSGQKEHFSF